MLLSCFRPSSGPTATCDERPSKAVKIGAQITVEKRESSSTCRLTTTKTRDRLGSAAEGWATRYSSPRFIAELGNPARRRLLYEVRAVFSIHLGAFVNQLEQVLRKCDRSLDSHTPNIPQFWWADNWSFCGKSCNWPRYRRRPAPAANRSTVTAMRRARVAS